MAAHLRYVESASRRLARAVFHAMVWYQIKMEKKQAFLFRSVDIAMELFVMVATIARPQAHRDPCARVQGRGDDRAVLPQRDVLHRAALP